MGAEGEIWSEVEQQCSAAVTAFVRDSINLVLGNKRLNKKGKKKKREEEGIEISRFGACGCWRWLAKPGKMEVGLNWPT